MKMFDFVSRYNSRPKVCTKEVMNRVMKSPVVVKNCKEIAMLVKGKIEPLEERIAATTEPGDRDAMEREVKALWEEVAQIKKRLPAFCFQAHFKDGRRSNKSAVASGLCMFDIDDLKDPKAEFLDSKGKLKELGVVMAHITPSTRGLRYVFRRPQGMDIAQAQTWFARGLGAKSFDACTKDLARISFAVPEEYVLYREDEMFEESERENRELVSESQVSKEGAGEFGRSEKSERSDKSGESEKSEKSGESEESEKLERAERLGRAEESGQSERAERSGRAEESDKSEMAKRSDKSGSDEESEASMESGKSEASGLMKSMESGKSGDENCFKGIPFGLIIDRLLLMQGIDGEPVEGERNTTLYNLVRELRYICDFSQARLMQVVPRWGLSENEVSETVQSALATVRRTSMPPHLERSLRFLMAQQTEISEISGDKAMEDGERCGEGQNVSGKNGLGADGGGVKGYLWRKGTKVLIPSKLPRLMELITKSYPKEYHARSDDGIAAHSGDVGHAGTGEIF
jgi:hypothetical protein